MTKVNCLLISIVMLCSGYVAYAQSNTASTINSSSGQAYSSHQKFKKVIPLVADNREVICPAIDVMTKKLENLVNNKPSVSSNADEYWTYALNNLTQSADFQTLGKELSNNNCQNKASSLLVNLKDIFMTPKYRVYFALEEIYFLTSREDKLVNFCKNNNIGESNIDFLKNACSLSIRRLADQEYFDKKDYKRALELYRESADCGDNSGISQSQIAYMYSNGLGTSQSSISAIEWYQRALPVINDNSLRAYILNEIGANYMAIMNYVTAFQYFREAAMMGYSFSQLNVALLYAEGYGTIQNNKEAYAWVSVALAQGFPGDPQKQVEAERLKNSLSMAFWAINGNFNELNSAKALAQQYYNQYALHQNFEKKNNGQMLQVISTTPDTQIKIFKKPTKFFDRLKAAMTAFNEN